MNDRSSLPLRVKAVFGATAAVLAVISGLVGAAVSSSDFIGRRAVAQASVSRDLASLSSSLADLHEEVKSNHEETKGAIAGVHDESQRSIAALSQSWHEARDKRDGELARVGDRIERLQQDVTKVQTDVAGVRGYLQYVIKTAPQ